MNPIKLSIKFHGQHDTGLLMNGAAKILFLLILMFVASASTVCAQTPVAANGRLRVTGTALVNEHGSPVQIRGMSSHGVNWFTENYNFHSLNRLVNDWGIDVFRIAMYPTEKPNLTVGGYEGNPEFWKRYIDELVDLCGKYGIYVIIDWHVLTPGNPNDPDYLPMAKDFWNYMSQKHAGKTHIIYEIANEPNGVSWKICKKYAETIIPIIRGNDPHSIIIIGTPTWSSDVDKASEDPITGYNNLMYAFHFYAGSHGDRYRKKVISALNSGIAVFVSEWGTTTADGDGLPDEKETDLWMDFLEKNKISWCNWSYSDKQEGSAALVAYSAADELWDNTSLSGNIVKKLILYPPDSWSSKVGNRPPVVEIDRSLRGAYIIEGESRALTADALDSDGSVAFVDYYANGNLIGVATVSPYEVIWKPQSSGKFTLTAKVIDDQGGTNSSVAYSINVVPSVDQTAYPDGTPHKIPGLIRGIDFDSGGEMAAYHDFDEIHKGPAGSDRSTEGADVEGSDNIGYVLNGEWYEYTVDVQTTGPYDFILKVASGFEVIGKIHLEIDGIQIGNAASVPYSGDWSRYQEVEISDVPLVAGVQVIRLAIDKGYFNFADMEFTNSSDP